uniref:Uncharacterized protein n=1 Tax=Candidatus Kentrum sp. LPFa TaxID=2126335 RepID=A0A450WT02_9GAMM|nr:MAG: hypothetical protein BECKLPF1236A_GA0070988_102516 [Candidatus Kentron sp. LPFa]VFK30626.1 MAG: hypothetical protein BECKLPF1236C_GA0070990_101166 [Candidatus Kentron sp. LPFa]
MIDKLARKAFLQLLLTHGRNHGRRRNGGGLFSGKKFQGRG